MILQQSELDRLAKILGRLGSEHAGERASAGLKAHELIKSMGLQWSDVIGGRSVELTAKWSRTVNGKIGACLSHPDLLNEWEAKFLRSISRQRYTLTPKQAYRLDRISERVAVARAA
jgi:hypothetical protein